MNKTIDLGFSKNYIVKLPKYQHLSVMYVLFSITFSVVFLKTFFANEFLTL